MKKYISIWHSFNYDNVSKFVHITNDTQQMHIDKSIANYYGFDDILVPGFYTLSLLPSMLESTSLVREVFGETEYGINCGIDTVRFASPVLISDKIQAVFRIKEDIKYNDGSIRYIFKVKVNIQETSRTALTAVWKVKIFPKSIDNN